jgi:hypothetical protein
MSFSIELHCDAGDDCENNRESPVVMVWAKEGIASATRELQAAALKGGWKRLHSGLGLPDLLISKKQIDGPQAIPKTSLTSR